MVDEMRVRVFTIFLGLGISAPEKVVMPLDLPKLTRCLMKVGAAGRTDMVKRSWEYRGDR